MTAEWQTKPEWPMLGMLSVRSLYEAMDSYFSGFSHGEREKTKSISDSNYTAAAIPAREALFEQASQSRTTILAKYKENKYINIETVQYDTLLD
ncbi:hypothetical protein CEXT_350111 [Caerostris extrusa]|uniref:Uncharacterized protein n=1 Tax=Caerostris extrusa TaxID=172846 RepID=A0AAV4P5U9_CAEEX|nr:hypothetical protein CEXT_350111 [Caerostris extrusa]